MDKETSPEVLIIKKPQQNPNKIHARWTEGVLKAVINIFPLHYNICHSRFLFCPAAAGRMDKLDHKKEEFSELQLRKVPRNKSSITTSCLQIQEGSLGVCQEKS